MKSPISSCFIAHPAGRSSGKHAEIQKCPTVMLRFTLNQSDLNVGAESVDEDACHLFGPVEDPLW